MFKTKIATMALAGIISIGGTGVTAFAMETTATTPEKPSISISFDKEAKAAELAEKQANMEAMAIGFAEKGLAFEQAQANMQEKLSESGKTQEEIDELMGRLTEKFDQLKAEKGIEISEKQAEREANTAAREEKGIVKGSKNTEANILA